MISTRSVLQLLLLLMHHTRGTPHNLMRSSTRPMMELAPHWIDLEGEIRGGVGIIEVEGRKDGRLLTPDCDASKQ